MSRANRIQQALLGIGDGDFHEYADLYLYYHGYTFLTSSGAVIGKAKSRKGTPDTYIPVDDELYIFCEYTTREKIGSGKKWFKKLSDDVDHCFDESKSKIRNEQIKKVILCFTQKLKVNEHDELRKKCRDYGAVLETHDIDELARGAIMFPRLAKLLGVSVDTGQLLTPSDFVKEYERGKLATSLSNTLYFRDDEIKQALSHLEQNNLLIITGNAGVGKSRFALEIAEQFCNASNDFTTICIGNKGLSVHEDVKTQLDPRNNYLLVIDDANRISDNYRILVSLLHEDGEGKIKIIATVRDHALHSLANESKNFFSKTINLELLTDQQIRKIIESDDFNIANRNYSDVIVRIAQGNPRLAIMASKVALEKQSLLAFSDVAKVYESYYEGVVQEIDELNDPVFLKTLGLISFFRTIGKDHEDNEFIFSTFEISENDFWEKITVLHGLELVDIYDHSIVKISDQILAMYFFYKVFIRDGILPFERLLITFYEKHGDRFTDMIYPVVNTFGFAHVKEKIRTALDKAWDHFADSEALLLAFLQVFWIFNQERTLSHIGKQLAALSKSVVDHYIFDKRHAPPVWHRKEVNYYEVLNQFLKHPINDFPLALDLIFLCLEKQPQYIPSFVELAKSTLAFDDDDFKTNFWRQTVFFDKLLARIRSNQNPSLYRGLFYHIAHAFLLTAFQQSNGLNRQNALTLYTIVLPNSQPIQQLRKKLWQFIFDDYIDHPHDVTSMLWQYVTNNGIHEHQDRDAKIDIWTSDAELLLSFVRDNFDAHSFEDCELAQAYLERLTRHGIPYDPALGNQFSHPDYVLSQKLEYDLIYGRDRYKYCDDPQFKNDNGKADRTAIDNLKFQELEELVSDYQLDDYKKLWRSIHHITEVKKTSSHGGIAQAIWSIACILAKEDSHMCVDLLQYIQSDDDLLKVSRGLSHHLPPDLLASLGVEHKKLYSLIKDFFGIDHLGWKFSFFTHLDSKYIDDYYIAELLQTFEQIDTKFSFPRMDFLEKYNDGNVLYELTDHYSLHEWVDRKNVFSVIASILLRKVNVEKLSIGFEWDFISQYGTQLGYECVALKEIYCQNFLDWSHFDMDCKEMKAVCQHCPEFIVEFMERFYDDEQDRINPEFPAHIFRVAWDLDNYEMVMDKLMSFAQKNMAYLGREHFSNKFFARGGKEEVDKMNRYIKSFIEKNAHSKDPIRLIFNVILHSFSSEFISFLEFLLHLNRDPELFSRISLNRNDVIVGSRIPVIGGQIGYLKNLDQMLESHTHSSDLVQHRLVVKDEISRLEKDIRREERWAFEGRW